MDTVTPPSIKLDDVTAAPIPAANATTNSPEGMVCAYASIMIMALIPIFVGSFKSIKHQVDTRAKSQATGEQAETMTDRDAAMFPLIASCALFGFYILIKLSPDLVNLVLSGYFFVLGIFAIHRIIAPWTCKMFPKKYNSTQYAFLFGSKQLSLTSADDNTDGRPSPTDSTYSLESDGVPTDVIFACKFTNSDILASILGCALGGWYIYTKHWVANNAFGLAFALNGIELLPVNTMKIGCILLCGLFFYDVFWVFGTDVMVSVAKKFDAPIKIVFPQDFLVRGFWGKNFAMLGLGDIVIPGIFIAFLLRFDHSLNRRRNVYFWSCFIAYILGLGTTIGIMSYFKHAQPALLYLVPACISVPLIVSIIKGDLGALMKYRDHPAELEDQGDSGDEEEDEGDESTDKERKKGEGKTSGPSRVTRSSKIKKDE